MTLFCLPHAGGSKASLENFTSGQPGDFTKVIAMELPGRGSRYKEPLLPSIQDLVQDIFTHIDHEFEQPFAFFGHSMGALLAYELTHYLRAQGYSQPKHLFLSGRKAPSIKEKVKLSKLNNADLLAQLNQLGGMSDELFNDESFTNYILPIFRSDFSAVENYEYQPRPKLRIPITLFLGTNDSVSHEDALAWQKETSAEFKIEVFEGNHFFIFQQQEAIWHTITESLKTEFA